jgi:hypothetical protein
MADLFSTCHAIGRLEYLLDDVFHRPADERLVLVAEVIADLRRDLGMTDNPDTPSTTESAAVPAVPTDGSDL